MKARIEYFKLAPDGMKAMLALESYLAKCGLDHKLVHMLKLRASQINGCAYCIDMHWKDARAAGETEQRLYALDAWGESPFYSDAERAALEWVEALTRLDGHVPDAVFDRVRSHFSEVDVVHLTFLSAAINAWNRIAISMRSVPGVYQTRGAH